jgi:hypothetical protein
MKLYPTIKKMLYPVLDESIKSVFISIDVHNALMIHITSSYILMNVVLFLGFNFYSSLHVLPSRRIAFQALPHSIRSRDAKDRVHLLSLDSRFYYGALAEWLRRLTRIFLDSGYQIHSWARVRISWASTCFFCFCLSLYISLT